MPIIIIANEIRESAVEQSERLDSIALEIIG